MIRVSICINIWNDAYRCRTSRIQKRHSFHKLSTAGTFQTCEHLACKSAPTITNSFSLNSCALGNPDLAEFKYSSAREGQSANRGAGSTCTGVFHGISSNVEKPPVKVQLSTPLVLTDQSVLSGSRRRKDYSAFFSPLTALTNVNTLDRLPPSIWRSD